MHLFTVRKYVRDRTHDRGFWGSLVVSSEPGRRLAGVHSPPTSWGGGDAPFKSGTPPTHRGWDAQSTNRDCFLFSSCLTGKNPQSKLLR